MSSSHEKIKKLKTKSFWIAFEMIFIFGIPAAVAVLVSRWMSWGTSGLYILLPVAFVLSWVVVFFRVRKLSRELDQAKKDRDRSEETT